MSLKLIRYTPFLTMFATSLFVGALIQFLIASVAVDQLTGDQGDYHRLAVHFKATGQFGQNGEVAYRAPLYPVLLGQIYGRLGSYVAVARGVNWFLGGLIAVAAGLIAHKLSDSFKAAWLAVGLVCLNSYWWIQQTEIMPENLAAVLIAASVWCWPTFSSRTRAISRRLQKHGGWVAASGFFLGLSLLCKPILLPALLLLPILAVVFSPANQRQSQVAFGLIFLVVAMIPVMGWSYRNYKVLKQWVPITTGSGEVFWGAHAPDTLATAKGSWTHQPLPQEFQAKIDSADESRREVISSEVRWEAGWHSLRSAAFTDVALHFVMKPLRLWSPSTFFTANDWGQQIAKMLLNLLNSLVLLSFFYQLSREYTIRPLVLSFVIGLTITSFIFWGTIRFQYILLPVIASMAAQQWYRHLPDWRIFRKPSQRRRVEKFRQVKFE